MGGLRARDLVGAPVDGGGLEEHEPWHTGGAHRLEQVERTGDIGPVISSRLLYRLLNQGERRKMQHAVVAGQNPLRSEAVTPWPASASCRGDDATDVARPAGHEEFQGQITSGPRSVRIKVSSAFAPVMEGFQAKAWPGRISREVSPFTITSRAA